MKSTKAASRYAKALLELAIENKKVDAIAKDMGAVFVKLNGPRYWLLDGLGSKVAVVDPVFRDFNGIQMRRIATIPLGADFAAGAYVVRNVNRGAVFFFDAGKKLYFLVLFQCSKALAFFRDQSL
jgi:hypothetical protein